MKYCYRCRERKPLSEFGKNRSKKDGMADECKKCIKELSRIRYESRKDEMKQKQREYATKNRQREAERSSKWRAEHPEERKGMLHKYYLKNAGWFKKLAAKWNHEHPDYRKVLDHNRRVKTKQNGGVITAKEWKELKEKYGNKCLRCGKEEKLSMDHIVPVSKGGSNTIDNIQPLCLNCNSSKQTKIIDYRKNK